MLKILKEGNSQSAQILSKAITSGDLKDDARNSVIRGNDLFNALSEAGYNVLVKIDKDGTTQLRSLLDAGYIQMTITNPTNKIAVYSGGQYELSKENLNKIEEIIQIADKY